MTARVLRGQHWLLRGIQSPFEAITLFLVAAVLSVLCSFQAVTWVLEWACRSCKEIWKIVEDNIYFHPWHGTTPQEVLQLVSAVVPVSRRKHMKTTNLTRHWAARFPETWGRLHTRVTVLKRATGGMSKSLVWLLSITVVDHKYKKPLKPSIF